MNPVVWVILLLAAADAFGRAGGGGKWSGGGGRGGGSGGGDGIGVLIWVLLRLIIHYPAVGIPLALIVIPTVIYFGYKSQQSAQGYYQGRTIHRAHQAMQTSSVADGLGAIRRNDSGFERSNFLARVAEAFRKIQHAWCNHDLDAVRAFISDGIYERFSLQIREQQARGVSDHMENLTIHTTTIAGAEADETFETVTVRITASAVDYEVDAETGRKASGSGSSEAFTEFWTFIRKPGTQTTGQPGLIEGNCPNCGASLELNLSAKCESCGSLIKSGEYDWVLSEITQASEWHAGGKKSIVGVDAIRQEDANFSVQQLEDRASVMFWRFIESLRVGKAAPIRKMATDGVCDELRSSFKPGEDGMREYFGDCAVGSVDTLGIVVGEPMDQALVEIRWSGVRFSTDGMAKTRKVARTNISTHVFVLSRKHGAGASGAALSSAHCPNCGAPVSDEASDACEYCGTVLNDGNSDWVLEHIGTPYDEVVRAVAGELDQGRAAPDADSADAFREDAWVSDPGGLQVAGWLVKVMLADGEIDDEEEALLVDYAASRDIPHSQLQEMVDSVHAGTFQTAEPRSPQEARAWLTAMASMALADGSVSKEEEAALTQLGQRLDYSPADIKQIIRKARAQLYRESKQQLRAARRSTA